MRATNVALDSEAFANGKEVLMEEYDMTEKEAERRYETIITNVMLEAQNAGRNWEKDEYEAVVDVLMGIQRQQQEQLEKMEESQITTIAQYLPIVLMSTALAQAVAIAWFVTMGGTAALILAGFLSVAVLTGANVLLT